MKVTVCAVGRLAGRSEERALTDDYMGRFDQTGRKLGWGPFSEVEVEARKGSSIICRQAARLGRSGARRGLCDWRRRRDRSGSTRQRRYVAVFRGNGLAAQTGAGDAGGTIVPCRLYRGGRALSSGLGCLRRRYF